MAWTDFSSAPPVGTVICRSDDLNGVITLMVTSDAGNLPLLVLRTSGGIRAYVNACPHQYLPLDYRGPQILSADGTQLMCTAHGARFDAKTGQVHEGADCGLDRVPVIERGGQLIVGP
ncbi:Rieske 2Fe-2S domain-containing protein [Puniceibacterium sp. IMCC21224]|uniref:Rieske (2Fe-2S) protein n=1 Tax=Puniceibacterium sp. IMCC21224 TaxID=1618204 RepID=UPI00064DE160|nr:Rieske 2Fe-2S domain-containing protein [Puniceibacterium sp. IMCC21224]KMK68443.1 ferredoxin subunit of nitrite reductase and ring-hydroxylating dioxygenase [Puniceibacterium sp. IMCC21224]